ncbi:probable NAD(P)H dehydrogenase subunit CRR3, chloroplastic [Magnolia sinica]|uniref:probable NAD(P)H dehydrogenase subunit CRR3, chloroplastic n=1 Tax=Magnolia sinica TaxID=86752 RepID=UPI00265A17AD|nr:probable NAD(P)H dehydrogenase subunit CRR3, chloroplastic [Magnolia sinica]
MECLAVGHFSPAITTVKASLPNNNNNNSPRTPSRNRTPGMRRINGGPSPAKPKQQPSILEVERAIGAGIFRDQDDPRSDGGSTFFDLLSTTIGQPEGSAERKLREAGEWIVERTENGSRSGQEILMVVCLKILPLWVFFLLVASGVVQLPFNIPFLDDFLE